jgi:hypothetical protein
MVLNKLPNNGTRSSMDLCKGMGISDAMLTIAATSRKLNQVS